MFFLVSQYKAGQSALLPVLADLKERLPSIFYKLPNAAADLVPIFRLFSPFEDLVILDCPLCTTLGECCTLDCSRTYGGVEAYVAILKHHESKCHAQKKVFSCTHHLLSASLYHITERTQYVIIE